MGLIYKTCVDGAFDEAYTCDPCFTAENGNVRSLVLIRKGTVIAFPLVKFDWELQVGLGNIFIMPETRGFFDGGTPKYITGYGSVKEKKVGDDYVLSVKDPNYVDNVAFYQEAEKHLWNIAYLSETQLNYVDKDVTITAKAPIEEDLETDVAWNLELKWFSKIKPVTAAYTTIASLFLNDGSGFEYEVITGLSLASGTVNSQLVTLAVDTDKTCYVVLPDGSILTSTDGVISDDWVGAAGAVTLIVSKTSVDVGMSTSDFIGSLLVTSTTGKIDLSVCTGITSLAAPNATELDCSDCTSLTSVSAPNATTIACTNCTSLTSVSAPNATGVYCYGCALTATSIASVLAELVATGNANGGLDISGGTNADYATWSIQAQSDSATLISRGWTVTYNS